MHLTLPKYVKIKNARLRRFYVVSMIFTSLIVLAVMYLAEQYVELDLVSTRLVIHIDRPSLEGVYGKNSTRNVSDGTESPLCPKNRFSKLGECIGEQEGFVEVASDEVFLVTSWQVGDGPRRLVPLAEDVGINFHYVYEIATAPGNEFNPLANMARGVVEQHSNQDTWTEVLNSQGVPQMIRRPGEPIVLTIPQLISLAGANPQDTRGLRKDVRTSGAELAARIDCWKEFGGDSKCKLCVKWVALSATKLALVSTGQDVVPRRYSGFRLRGEHGAGEAKEISFTQIVTVCGTAIVYLSLPLKFFEYFTCYCLGQLSKIYKRALVDPVDAVVDSAHVALRLMSASVQFVDLSRLGNSVGITRKVVRDRMRKMLSHRQLFLDDNETEALVNFVYGTCLRKSTQAEELVAMGKTHSSFMKRTVSDLDGAVSSHINVDAFSEACTSNDKLTFDAIVQLFDTDRQRTCLERLFTPCSLLKALDRARAASESTDDLDFDDESFTSEEGSSVSELGQRRTSQASEIWQAKKRASQLERRSRSLESDASEAYCALNSMVSRLSLRLRAMQCERREHVAEDAVCPVRKVDSAVVSVPPEREQTIDSSDIVVCEVPESRRHSFAERSKLCELSTQLTEMICMVTEDMEALKKEQKAIRALVGKWAHSSPTATLEQPTSTPRISECSIDSCLGRQVHSQSSSLTDSARDTPRRTGKGFGDRHWRMLNLDEEVRPEGCFKV